ncbi:MAG: hypothetical protein JW847_09190 [Candidatus Omnitrophica bacterium]|nr:hypothetical protein [Candidatus Omnitrophota bacterium]
MLLVFVLTGLPAYAQNWQEFKRQHFIIYYKKAPYDFVETVYEMAEEYYVEITHNLGFTRYKGWNWEDRAKIYIYDSMEDYVESGKQAGWSAGSAYPADRTIRTFPSSHGFFDSTLPHELGHIIFREFVGFKAQIPAWFEEGVAMYQEKAKRWGAHDVVRKAIEDGTFVPLPELTITNVSYRASADLVNLFYAESASIVNFMINELGDQRFVYLCRKLKDGEPFPWVLDSVYSRLKNIDDLNEAWVKYLKNE